MRVSHSSTTQTGLFWISLLPTPAAPAATAALAVPARWHAMTTFLGHRIAGIVPSSRNLLGRSARILGRVFRRIFAHLQPPFFWPSPCPKNLLVSYTESIMNRLSNPPSGIGGKFVIFFGVIFFDSFFQSDFTLFF